MIRYTFFHSLVISKQIKEYTRITYIFYVFSKLYYNLEVNITEEVLYKYNILYKIAYICYSTYLILFYFYNSDKAIHGAGCLNTRFPATHL